MPTWVPIVLSFAGPIVVGLITAVIGATALTRGRLRRELVSDAQILAALPRGAQAALRDEMVRKSKVMVALSQNPVLIPADLLRLLGLLFGLAGVGISLTDFIDDGPVDSGTALASFLLLGVADRMLVAFATSVQSRARRRATLTKALAPVGDDPALTDYFVETLIFILVFAVVLPPILLGILLIRESDLPQETGIVPLLVGTGYAMNLLMKRIKPSTAMTHR